jgi:hypothetical protein
MENGEYRDDPAILDEADLWRRIPPKHFVKDDNLGQVRPSSAAFENHPNGSPMSVVLADAVIASSRAPDAVLTGHEGFALAAITAGLARECEQGIAREPLPDEPAHAVVFGKKTNSVKKRLAKGSRWVVPPIDL